MLSPEILAQLKHLEKLPYNPKPRDFIRNAPARGLMIIVDGITPNALRLAHAPTFDMLGARGASASDARSIFPTITGPAHTSLLTGARAGTHGFLYPKLLNAYGNRLEDFNEGLMRAETIAEAWRPNGLVTIGIGSRFLRGADMMITEGIVGEDLFDITDRSIQAVRELEPHFLMVVFYVADTMGHLFGPEAQETLVAIEQMDAMTARLLDAYAGRNMLDQTVVAIVADHGMARVDEVVQPDFVQRAGALPHGRLALAPSALSLQQFESLMNDPRVEDIYGRDELELLGAWGPGWGEQVIHLKAGMMFPHSRELRGYHGAWSLEEQQIPLILSGAGIRTGGVVETCELIDLAPTLALLLGGDSPEQAEGRVLWEALDAEPPPAADYARFVLTREAVLAELKTLKKEFAGGAVYREEFEMRRSELKRLVEENRKEAERARDAESRWDAHGETK
jgi:arylsulfatase A-like enzyme